MILIYIAETLMKKTEKKKKEKYRLETLVQ